MIPVRRGHVGVAPLRSDRVRGAVRVVDVSNRRLDRKQGEAQHHEARRQPVEQGSTHGRYLNLMIGALKAVSVCFCILGVAAAVVVGVWRGGAEGVSPPPGAARCNCCKLSWIRVSAGPNLTKSGSHRAPSCASVVHFLAHGQCDGCGEDPRSPHGRGVQLSATELCTVALYVPSLAGVLQPNARSGQ